MRFDAAGVFVDGDDGDDHAVFGEVFAVADDDFFDFFEGAGIDQDASCGDRIATVDAVFGEFDALAVFEKKNFAGDARRVDGRGRRGGRDVDIRRERE